MDKKVLESTLVSLGFENKVKDTGINWVTFVACVFSEMNKNKKQDIGEAALKCYKKMK